MHLFILGFASIVSTLALMVVLRFDVSLLATFGPTAQIYFGGIKNGLITATVILIIALVSSIILGRNFGKIESRLKNFWNSLGQTKKNLLILAICFTFAFISHAGNILNGYFSMDDFIVTSTNRLVSFQDTVLTPYGNDHMIPLYKGEMKVLDSLFGVNHIPYNTFVFILFALIPFFTYLTFRRLNIGTKSFFVFLVIFTGATSWADMLTGLYIMSMYPQVVLFFSIALWAYTAWTEERKNKYLVYFVIAALAGVLINTSGVWTLPALLLYMAYHSYIKQESFGVRLIDARRFFRENYHSLFCLIFVTLIFAISFYISFKVIQPDTFLTALGAEGVARADFTDRKEYWKPLPLAKNFLSFFASGVSLPLLAPNAVKILAHPAVKENAIPLWPFLTIFILALNVLFFSLVWKNSPKKEKKFIIWLLVVMFITISMVILARPNHETIPDFDYRYAGVPFYFYSIFLALSSSLILKKRGNAALRLIIPIVIIIFSAQQAFGFHSLRLKEESIQRRDAIVNLNRTLLKELETLSKTNLELRVPNLSGSHILQKMPGLTLANYVIFFDMKAPLTLIQNTAQPPESGTSIVKKVKSLRTSTSPEFKQVLMEQSAVRSYYMDPGIMLYETLPLSDTETNNLNLNQKREIVIKQSQFDPEKLHTVVFTLITDNVPGNIKLAFYFKNDFDMRDVVGNIRVDDYTSYKTLGDKRVYRIRTDLLQLFSFALSEKISDLIISVPNLKNAAISEIKLF
ncbi:MAG: hypothetical protein AAB484_02710 [Patescibacteria group bacterium]